MNACLPHCVRRCLVTIAVSLTAIAPHAQPVDPPASFALIGHIEKLVLTTPGLVTSAAVVTVRGIDVTLPANLVITMPGGYLTAEQLFRGRDFKSPATPPRSGLALQEFTDAEMQCPVPLAAPGKRCPLPAAEIELGGNIVGGVYVAGLARISQGGLHIGSGFIRSIGTDPADPGLFTVGADVASGPVARLRLNDPEGIYGPIPPPGAVDMRFALDPGNAPIHARTGFPVCLTDAGRAGVCPASNRSTNTAAANYRRFTCGASPAGVTEPVLPGCQPHLPVPLQVGDYISYVGMLDKDAKGYFVSLHGLEAELGVYTSPGVDPAYTFIEVAIQGTLGALYPLTPTTSIPQEATSRYKIVGFTTDPSRTVTVTIFDDANPVNGNPLNITTVPTRLATRLVPTNLAQLGRFKMIWAAKEAARVVRRNARVLLSPATLPSNPAFAPSSTSNAMAAPLLPAGASTRGGYTFGQFEAPVNEYISPETTRFGVTGWPVPVNFEDFCYLRLTNTIVTQEPVAAPTYRSVAVGPLTPSPINPARPKSQLRADGSRVCGAL
jgi:hypothetical protein